MFYTVCLELTSYWVCDIGIAQLFILTLVTCKESTVATTSTRGYILQISPEKY